MGIFQHGVGEFLAEFAATVEFVVGEEEEGDDEEGDESHLDEERYFELGRNRGTELPVEMIMAVMP
jgi:hypothetical protein